MAMAVSSRASEASRIAAAAFQTAGGGRPGLLRPAGRPGLRPPPASTSLSVSDPQSVAAGSASENASETPIANSSSGALSESKPDLRAQALAIYVKLQNKKQPLPTVIEPNHFFLKECRYIALDEAFAEFRRRYKKEPNAAQTTRIHSEIRALFDSPDTLLAFRQTRRGNATIVDSPENSDDSVSASGSDSDFSSNSGSGSGSLGSDSRSGSGLFDDSGDDSPAKEQTFTAENIHEMPIDLRLLRKHIRKQIIVDKEFKEHRRHKKRLFWASHDADYLKFASTFDSLQGSRNYQEDTFVSYSLLNEAFQGGSSSSSSLLSPPPSSSSSSSSSPSLSSSSSPSSPSPSSSSSSSSSASSSSSSSSPKHKKSSRRSKHSSTELAPPPPAISSHSDSSLERKTPRQALFGIFDGHGGARAAREARIDVPRLFLSHPNMVDAPQEALHYAFEEADRLINDRALKCREESGCTAIVAVLRGLRLWVANVGDSQGFLCRAGVALELSNIHHPNRADERARITECGGAVIFFGGWRVDGKIAVSRSLGDNQLKGLVIGTPEILEFVLMPSDEFIVLATDGLWDVMSPQEVVDEIHARLKKGKAKDVDRTKRDLPKGLCELAIAKGSKDNVSVLIVWLAFDQRDGVANAVELPFASSYRR